MGGIVGEKILSSQLVADLAVFKLPDLNCYYVIILLHASAIVNLSFLGFHLSAATVNFASQQRVLIHLFRLEEPLDVHPILPDHEVRADVPAAFERLQFCAVISANSLLRSEGTFGSSLA